MKPVLHVLSPLVAATLLLSGCANERQAKTDSQPQNTANTANTANAAHAAPAADAKPEAKSEAPAAPAKAGKPKDFPAKGMYVTATSVALPRYKDLIAGIKAAGGNTIIIDAKDEWGLVMYDSKLPLVKKMKADREAPIKNLREKVAYAHKHGIHVAARVVCFQDPILAKHRPDLAPKDVNGGVWKELGKQIWLDPSKQEAQDYNIAIGKELAEMGVDEVQWDYVRFPAMGKTQNARYDFDMKAKQKHEIITGFVKRGYEQLKPTGVLISADVYGIMAWAQPIDVKITGQLLEDMAKHVDVLCPMVYPSHFNNGFAGIARPADSPYLFVHKGVSLMQKKVAGTGVVVRPWLQAMPYKVSHFTPRYVTEQIKAADDTKAIGWMLWNAQNKYEVGFAGAKAYVKRGN